MRKDPLQLNHPSLKSKWRRVLILGLLFAWSAVEFANANPYWAVFFDAVGLYALWFWYLRKDRE